MNERGRPLHVVAAAIIENGRVLVARRLPGGRHGGLWEFPGGKVENGENPRDALARELTEELGIGVRVGELLTAIPWTYPERSIVLETYRCEIERGEPSPLECAEIAWVTEDGLARLPMPEADADIVKALCAILRGGA